MCLGKFKLKTGIFCTYHSATNRMNQNGFSLSKSANFKEQNIRHGVIHGDGNSIQVGNSFGQFVDVFGRNGHQFSPSPILWQGDNLIAHLEKNHFQLQKQLKVAESARFNQLMSLLWQIHVRVAFPVKQREQRCT